MTVRAPVGGHGRRGRRVGGRGGGSANDVSADGAAARRRTAD
ncbi:hypothetical protein [Streptomyces thioluteus]